MIEPHIYGQIDGLNCDQWIFMMIFFFVLFLFCTVLLFTSLCADISLSKDIRDHVKTHWTLVYGLILFDHCSNWGDEEGKPHGALFLSFTRYILNFSCVWDRTWLNKMEMRFSCKISSNVASVMCLVFVFRFCTFSIEKRFFFLRLQKKKRNINEWSFKQTFNCQLL